MVSPTDEAVVLAAGKFLTFGPMCYQCSSWSEGQGECLQFPRFFSPIWISLIIFRLFVLRRIVLAAHILGSEDSPKNIIPSRPLDRRRTVVSRWALFVREEWKNRICACQCCRAIDVQYPPTCSSIYHIRGHITKTQNILGSIMKKTEAVIINAFIVITLSPIAMSD